MNVNKEVVERVRKTPHDKRLFDFGDDELVRVHDTVEVEEWTQVFPELAQERQELKERGCGKCFLLDIIIIYNKGSIVRLKNGAYSYHKSECPFYSGYWLLGGCGNVDCKSSLSPVPGRINDLYCIKDYTACPLYKIEKEVNNG